ncbi:hypothetical protein COBT_001917 [Conglomerata obtusa]
MTFNKTNEEINFANFISGISHKKPVPFNSHPLYDNNNNLCTKVDEHNISSYTHVGGNITASYKDGLLFASGNVFTYIKGNLNIECVVKDRIINLFIVKADSFVIFVVHKNYSTIYKVKDQRILLVCEINWNIIQVEYNEQQSFYIAINKKDEIELYLCFFKDNEFCKDKIFGCKLSDTVNSTIYELLQMFMTLKNRNDSIQDKSESVLISNQNETKFNENFENIKIFYDMLDNDKIFNLRSEYKIDGITKSIIQKYNISVETIDKLDLTETDKYKIIRILFTYIIMQIKSCNSSIINLEFVKNIINEINILYEYFVVNPKNFLSYFLQSIKNTKIKNKENQLLWKNNDKKKYFIFSNKQIYIKQRCLLRNLTSNLEHIFANNIIRVGGYSLLVFEKKNIIEFYVSDYSSSYFLAGKFHYKPIKNFLVAYNSKTINFIEIKDNKLQLVKKLHVGKKNVCNVQILLCNKKIRIFIFIINEKKSHKKKIEKTVTKNVVKTKPDAFKGNPCNKTDKKKKIYDFSLNKLFSFSDDKKFLNPYKTKGMENEIKKEKENQSIKDDISRMNRTECLTETEKKDKLKQSNSNNKVSNNVEFDENTGMSGKKAFINSKEFNDTKNMTSTELRDYILAYNKRNGKVVAENSKPNAKEELINVIKGKNDKQYEKCKVNSNNNESASNSTTSSSKGALKIKDIDEVINLNEEIEKEETNESINPTLSNEEGTNSFTTSRDICVGNCKHVDEILKINNKLDELCLKINDERMKNETENKTKFKKLLDTVSAHLNVQLINTVENTIKREVKTGILQLKKTVGDGIYSLEMKADKSNNERQYEPIRNKEILDTMKNTMVEVFLPVIESCIEEMKRQIVNEMKNKIAFVTEETAQPVISMKDEIINLINNESVNEAGMIAMDCDDEIMLTFVENIPLNLYEKLDVNLQSNLLKKSIALYGETENEGVLNFVSNILMMLDITELSINDLIDLENLFEIIKGVSNENLQLIVKMQGNQVKKTLARKSKK